MAPRLIIRHSGPSYALYLDEGDGRPRALATDVPYQHPLGNEDLRDIHWYIEEYPDAPFGAYRGRAKGIIERLNSIGNAVTQFALFDDEVAARLAGVLDDERLQVWVESDSPEVLSVPWELFAVGEARPLPRPANVVRTYTPSAEADREAALSPQPRAAKTPARILFIISRPLGVHDVSFGIVSRPVLRAFESFEDSIEVHVLRPPTFAAFQARLDDARRVGRPFTVVHFDGHGSLHLPAAQGTSSTPATGYVYFEKEGGAGGFEPVSAEQLASVLRHARIHMVVFNACESARFATQVPPEAVVATRLLREGIPAVVGMAYSVRAQTASAFMRVLYAALLRGEGIVAAVHEARVGLANRVGENNPSSDIEHDWFVPVLYATEDATLAAPRRLNVGVSELREAVLGRDLEFYELERYFRTGPFLLLYGAIGAGKTALLDDFLRWLRTSGGIPTDARVLRHDLRHEDPESILRALRGYGQTGDGPRLLVLENVDQIVRLGASAQETAHALVGVLSAPSLKTILTSRGPEHWLGDINRVYLGGLPERVSVELLSQSFDCAGLPRTSLRAFVESSFGNPGYLTRASRLLAETPDGIGRSLWDEPRGDAEHAAKLLRLFPEVEEAVRAIPQPVLSVAYFLSLFDRLVDPMMLAFASLGSEFVAAAEEQDENTREMFFPPPQRFHGISAELWQRLLQKLEDMGLASEVAGGLWELHPVTSVALGAAWELEAGDGFARELADAKRCLTKVLATFAVASQMTTTAARASGAAGDRRLLEHALCTAVRESFFIEAMMIYRSAVKLRSATGGAENVRELAETVRGLLREQCGGRPLPDDPSRFLWTLTFSENQNLFPSKEDNDAVRREAELIIGEIEQGLSVENTERAFAYHMLGAIAGNEGRADESESWYRKALEAADNDMSRYMTYRNLGVLAMQREDYDEAEANIVKARRIAEHSEIALPAGELRSLEGIIALKKGLTDKALDLQDQFATESDGQLNLSQKAGAMHELGIAHAREGNLREAEGYFKQAIKYKIALRNRASLFTTYSALGELKLRMGQTAEAEAWLREAQGILEELAPTPRPDMPRLSFVIRRAELLQHQHKYDEMHGLLEPVVRAAVGAAGAGEPDLELNQARVLLALSCSSTGRQAEVGPMLDAAVGGLKKLSLTSSTATVLRYLGMAQVMRAGTHGDDAARAVDDGLSGCEQLLASLKLDADIRGSLDYSIGLAFMFTLSRIDACDETTRSRAVAALLSWFEHLRASGGGVGIEDGGDFFPRCVVSISRLLIAGGDERALAEVLVRGLEVVEDPRRWPDRSRALAETLYFISQEVKDASPDFIRALEPRSWAALADAFPSPDHTSAMVYEFYVWAAMQLCRGGHVRLIESLRDDLESREREKGDVRAGEGMARLCIYLIVVYCMSGRVDDAARTLEELRLRAVAPDSPGAALISYAYSARNVVVSFTREGRMQEAARVTSQCVDITKAFGHMDSVADLLLGCAVEMAGAYGARGMFTEADAVVSRFESLRRSEPKIVDLDFNIANALLRLFFLSLEAGRVPLALGYAEKLSGLASLNQSDHRIAGADAIVSSNLVGVYAATGHLEGALALLPRMFATCLGGVFRQDPEITSEMKKLLADTVENLKNQLDRNGDRAGLRKANNLIHRLSSEYHYDSL